MARKPYKKIFGDKKRLGMMLTLRQNGWTYTSLAFIFDVDFSSIYHECKKFDVDRGSDSINFSVRSILSELGIQAKKEKMYADYLREAGYKSQVFYQKLSL